MRRVLEEVCREAGKARQKEAEERSRIGRGSKRRVEGQKLLQWRRIKRRKKGRRKGQVKGEKNARQARETGKFLK